MTNNFISDEQQNVSVEIDHSVSAALQAARGAPNAAAAARKGGNVFARLTDASGFTGMYRSIAEEKRQRLPVIAAKKVGLAQTQPSGKRGIEPLGSKSAAATPTHSAQQQQQQQLQQQQLQQHAAALAAASAGGQPAKWLTHLDSPLLSWPPPAPLSNANAGFTASHAADPSAPPRPAGSVFSRLTNPQLYTGAHRARFGLDVQTKHKAGPEAAAAADFPLLPTSYAAAAVAGAGGSQSAGGPHREAAGVRSRINSPSRSHTRQGSHIEYAATYDSAASASSLPTVSDSAHDAGAEDAEESAALLPALEQSGSESDLQFLSDIRREIRHSVERRPDAAGIMLPEDDDDEDEEVRSPVAAPVFHFSEDKENNNMNPNSGDEAAGGQQAGEAEAAKHLSSRRTQERMPVLQQSGQTQWRAEDGRPV